MAVNLSDFIKQIQEDPNLKAETKEAVMNIVNSSANMKIDTQNKKEKGPDINIIEVTGKDVPNPVRGAMFTKKTNTPFVEGDWLKVETISLIAAVLAKNGQAVANPEVKKQKKSNKLVTSIVALALALGISTASLIPLLGRQREKNQNDIVDNTNYIVELQEEMDNHKISIENFSEDIMTPFDGTSVEEDVDAYVKKATKKTLECNSYDEYVQKILKYMTDIEEQIKSGSITNEEAKELLSDFRNKDISIYSAKETAYESLVNANKLIQSYYESNSLTK